MKLSICILVFNKFNFTKSCLNDLSKLSNDHEIIVVDNGSVDETQSQLEGSKEIIYHRLPQNKGFSYGCNIAYDISSADKVCFLNNDIKVRSNYDNWTQILIDSCDNALVGPTMGQLDKELHFIQEANHLLSGNSYMSGWCLASSKKIWERLNLKSKPSEIFCEDFFCYFEDTDLSFRAKKLGIAMKVVDIPVVHFGKQSSSQLNVYQLYQNARKIFIKKWKQNVNFK